MSPKRTNEANQEHAAKAVKLDAEYIEHPRTVDIICAPFSGGQPRRGTDLGPKLMLDRGLVQQLTHLQWKVNCPDELDNYEHLIPKKEATYKVVKNIKYVSEVTQLIHEQVKESISKKHLALTLGGDHSLGIGTGSGAAAVYPDLNVIWVDAHAVSQH